MVTLTCRTVILLATPEAKGRKTPLQEPLRVYRQHRPALSTTIGAHHSFCLPLLHMKHHVAILPRTPSQQGVALGKEEGSHYPTETSS